MNMTNLPEPAMRLGPLRSRGTMHITRCADLNAFSDPRSLLLDLHLNVSRMDRFETSSLSAFCPLTVNDTLIRRLVVSDANAVLIHATEHLPRLQPLSVPFATTACPHPSSPALWLSDWRGARWKTAAR